MLSRPRSALRMVGRMPSEHDLHASSVGAACARGRPARRAGSRIRREAVAGEDLRIAVGLELELPELGREVGVVEPLEHLERRRHGPPGPVDEEHLLLGADAPDAGLEPALGQHALERAEVGAGSACMNSRRCCLDGSRRLTCAIASVHPFRSPSGPVVEILAAASRARSASRGATPAPRGRPGSGCPF